MNFQDYTNKKQGEGDLLSKEPTEFFYVFRKVEKTKPEEDFKAFTKAEHEAPGQRIKKRRAYKIPLL